MGLVSLQCRTCSCAFKETGTEKGELQIHSGAQTVYKKTDVDIFIK